MKHFNETHGHSIGGKRSATYRSWASMITRCTNPKNVAFQRYGGRGIVVCREWALFANFLRDMGQKPEGLTLDRIDNDGPYDPSNCRWATPLAQSNNRRSVVLYSFRGESATLAEWARRRGYVSTTLWQRVKRLGWSIEKALTEPPRDP